jgi:hypothetical protein
VNGNRLAQSIVAGLTKAFTYEPKHGFTTSMPHLPTMEYDFKDQFQMTALQVGAGAVERTYSVYDAGGSRVRKVTDTLVNGGMRRKEERL